MTDRYRRAQDEYFKLRGQFDTGRITQEQFDAALRELMIQDEQGRYWMLGADSGHWYYYDGTKWVQAEPYPGGAPAETPGARGALPEASPVLAVPRELYRAPAPAAPLPARERKFPLVPIVIGLAVMVLGALAAYLVLSGAVRVPFLAASTPRVITPILPPTLTRAPSPTVIAALPTLAIAPPTPLIPTATTAAPTAVQPTLAPTPLPTPTVEILIPTLSVETLPTLALETPVPPPTTPVSTIPPTEELPATMVPIPTATEIPPTATEIPPTTRPPTTVAPTQRPTATPSPTKTVETTYPPNVYVTALNYSPNPPKRNQPIAFTATFINTTGETRNFDWLILLFDPNKAGPNKGFGESQHNGISVPPGTREFTVTYQGVRGPGGCVSLYAHAAWQNANKDRTFFPNTDGNNLAVYFDVCP